MCCVVLRGHLGGCKQQPRLVLCPVYILCVEVLNWLDLLKFKSSTCDVRILFHHCLAT